MLSFACDQGRVGVECASITLPALLFGLTVVYLYFIRCSFKISDVALIACPHAS